ncbi:hypothetical protein F5884DRAFT_294632 [Xylogone sp. PMI_703]|nr:hypothetical protein F5884DRAFT_294632 [Xylogone sp. PMI_703]
MARLNEPLVAAESLESLKRKFIRQNRDIARVNSTQSLRIRNLENETSRLLAENLRLREQILRLETELQTGRAQRVAQNATKVKSQVDAKLAEIVALIATLGDEAQRSPRSPRTGKYLRTSPRQSLDQRGWKSASTLSEAIATQEGKLPTIVEDKFYPRRTLEQEEIADLIAEVNSADSPEIGSPPVSQFVDEDPVKIDLPVRTRSNDQSNLPNLDLSLSINLEQRKKRKDSIGPTTSKRPSRFEPTNGSRESSTPALKVGAKRKLSVREDDEREDTSKAENSSDEFKYARVNTEQKDEENPESIPEKAVNNHLAGDAGMTRGTKARSSTSQSMDNRRILAPKSVNDSPRKIGKTAGQSNTKDIKADISNTTKSRSGERKQAVIVPQETAEPIVSKVDILPEPETPAALDMFSPPFLDPSIPRAESRDTPPPSELKPGSEGQRPSRRARPAVSYAEPNLRDKMRRPTKELVDAVTGERKIVHRTSNVRSDDEGGPETATKIKPESETSDNWRQIPMAIPERADAPSPLSGKTSTSADLPSSITTHRKRRESILQDNGSDISKGVSSSTISALLAERRRSRLAARQEDISGDKEQAKSDVYEIRSSSPPIEPNKTAQEKAKGSKRHSPSQDASASADEASDATNKTSSTRTNRRQTVASGSGNREERMERVLARRRSMIS